MSQEIGDKTGAIVRFEVRPKKFVCPNELSRWQRFKRFVFPWLRKGKDFGQEYARARFAKEQNEAEKLAREASEIAARTDTERQRTVREFSKNVDAIFADDGLPEEAKMLKLAKLMGENPELEAQVETVRHLLDRLHDERGVSIQVLDANVEDVSALPCEEEDQSSTTE